MITFGQRLRELRTEKNITLEKLAEELQTTKATLSRYENNLRDPKGEFIEKVAQYFNVPVDYLLGRESFNKSKTSIISSDELTMLISKELNEANISTKNMSFKEKEQLSKKIVKILKLLQE